MARSSNYKKSELVIKRPRITEKASSLSGVSAYTFIVDKRATKPEIAKAISLIYNIKPVKIAVIPIKSKLVNGRKGKGKTAGGKKAVVYLKKGDTIEFV